MFGKHNDNDQTSLLDQLPDPVVDTSLLKETVRKAAPNLPGIYRMMGSRGEVLYVGKSLRIRTRLLSYFRLPWPEHRHARMLRSTRSIDWEIQPNEFSALLREARLIRSHMPHFNVRGARPLDKWWVIVIPDIGVPKLMVQRASTVAKSRSGARSAVIGPFANRRPLISAIRVLNDSLGLRDCPDRIPMVLKDSGDFFAENDEFAYTPGCHRYETKRCMGPCVAACSHTEYRVQLKRARDYLEGSGKEPIELIEREMAAASAMLSFERAGWLRDRLSTLETIGSQLSMIREALDRSSFVYRAQSFNGSDMLYLVRDGIVIHESRHDDLAGISRMIEIENNKSVRTNALNVAALEELMLVDSWFRNHPEEKRRTAQRVRDLL